jgi:ketosteroid isomerase-like protein
VYASDIVSFDLVQPMQHVGIAAYRRPWEETFASFEGRIGYEVSNLTITAAGDVAFSHSLNQMSGTMNSGQSTSMWVRWTACFRKLDGRWRITP